MGREISSVAMEMNDRTDCCPVFAGLQQPAVKLSSILTPEANLLYGDIEVRRSPVLPRGRIVKKTIAAHHVGHPAEKKQKNKPPGQSASHGEPLLILYHFESSSSPTGAGRLRVS
tara:strand:+ start:342 stop:686 length:345 start_codon:yes stop_codon:yes gene_type:complete